MNNVISLDKVVKVYDNKKEHILAIDRLSFQVKRGEIFSLVGPDGAGKTTLIRLMCGIIPLTSGKINILGYDVSREKDEVKKRIGYLSQNFNLYHDLTVDENIDFFAEIHKVARYDKRKEELLQFTRLTPFRDRLAGQLSGGMKQKLALVCTLIHTPDIIFLDEPTTGVDPLSRRDFWKILSSLLKFNITIFVTTPYLDEAERSSRVALINSGKLLICDTPVAVKSTLNLDIIEIVCDNVKNAYKLLVDNFERSSVQMFGDRLHILTHDVKRAKARVLELLEEKYKIHGLRIISPSLEDVFVAKMNFQ